MLRHAWDSVRPGRWCVAHALLADAAPSAALNHRHEVDVEERAWTAPHRSGTALPLKKRSWMTSG
ncbi:hypothetical protein GCM10017752_24160 [Streptomyces roseoviridis]